MFQVPPKVGEADYGYLQHYGRLLDRAVSVEATELAVFAVDRRFFGGMKLTRLLHVRPESATPEARRAAMNAFDEIVRRCIARGSDGAIEVEGANGDRPPQFCLVTLARRENRLIGAAAFIARFADEAEARRALETLERGQRGW